MILRIVDFESRGLPPDSCQIVEAATVDLIGHDTGDGGMEWTRGRLWRSFVNPKLPIPPEVSAIHHMPHGFRCQCCAHTSAQSRHGRRRRHSLIRLCVIGLTSNLQTTSGLPIGRLAMLT